MASPHPLNLVNAMKLVGYSMADMLPAYPGKDLAYVEELMRDTALLLNRPVIPYGLLGIYPCSSKYCNITEPGYRKAHREQAWPPDKKKKNLFFLGGSTTIGFCLEDADAIPAQLQRLIDEKEIALEVYNFGSGSYTCRHEALKLLDLIDRGFIPDYVFCLDGFNESLFAFGNPELVHVLNNLYRTEKRRRKMSVPSAIVDYLLSLVRTSPPLPAAENYNTESICKESAVITSDTGIHAMMELAERLDSSSESEQFSEIFSAVGSVVWEKYLTSVSLIKALGARHNFSTFFMWQPVPYYWTKPPQRSLEKLYYVYRYSALAAPVYHWLHKTRFPEMIDNPYFLDLSKVGENIPGVLYVDHGHYTPLFAKRIAERLLKLIESL